MKILTRAARKAQLGAFLAFLGPLGTYIAAEGQWSWRAFAGAVVSGLATGAGVYRIQNFPEEDMP